jgi:hypothetical protein
VTDRSIPRRVGVWYGNADIRQAPGMAATDDFTVVAWDDTRNTEGTNESQDIYSGVVQFNVLAADTPMAAQYALAAAAGVAVFGFLLLALSGSRRRRAPDQSSTVTPATSRRVTAG